MEIIGKNIVAALMLTEKFLPLGENTHALYEVGGEYWQNV